MPELTEELAEAIAHARGLLVSDVVPESVKFPVAGWTFMVLGLDALPEES